MKTVSVLLAVVMIIAFLSLSSWSDDPPCYLYKAPICPTAAKCSDTFCDVPSVEAINNSSVYSLDDIGLPTGTRTVGVLNLRTQDVNCGGESRWDEEHSVPEKNCYLSDLPGGVGDWKEISGTLETTECYIRKKCQTGCDSVAGAYSAVRTMTKNGVSKEYLLPEYRCTVQGDVEDMRIASEQFYRCVEIESCDLGLPSGGGE